MHADLSRTDAFKNYVPLGAHLTALHLCGSNPTQATQCKFGEGAVFAINACPLLLVQDEATNGLSSQLHPFTGCQGLEYTVSPQIHQDQLHKATHMMMVAELCEREGITFAAVGASQSFYLHFATMCLRLLGA